jgi:hypothetical protein
MVLLIVVCLGKGLAYFVTLPTVEQVIEGKTDGRIEVTGN